MEKLVDSIAKLVERFLLPIVLVVGFLLYQKFSYLFDKSSRQNEEQERQSAQHQDALVPDYKNPKAAKTKAEKDRINQENAEAAKLYKQALYAEKIRGVTEFGLDFTRVSKAHKIAADMKAHKVSISGTAAQYRKLTGLDMFKDMRVLMGSEYMKWLTVAGSVK